MSDLEKAKNEVFKKNEMLYRHVLEPYLVDGRISDDVFSPSSSDKSKLSIDRKIFFKGFSDAKLIFISCNGSGSLSVGMTGFKVKDIQQFQIDILDRDDQRKKRTNMIQHSLSLEQNPLESQGTKLENLSHSLIDLNYTSDTGNELSRNQMKKVISPALKSVAENYGGLIHKF